MTDPRATPAARLTLAHQALANLVGFACASIFRDQRFDDAMAMLEDLLPAARHDVPRAFVPVLEAAEGLVAAWPAVRARRSDAGDDWCRAMLAAQAAAADFLAHRAAAALEAHRRSLPADHADARPAAPPPETAHAR